jgi:hypothetical protein
MVLLLLVNGFAEEKPNPPTAKADFHVASGGKDSNDGTAAAPFATMARARDAVRSKVAAGLTGDALVLIHGGVYSQTETLTFGPEDSGTANYSITYAAAPGEQVILSGGRRIKGWEKGAGGIWTADLPEVNAGKWYFRQLFVDGKRATRARTPNADSPEPWCKIAASTASKEAIPAEDAPITVKITGPIKAYRNPSDVELVYMENNECGRKRLGTIDESAQRLTLAPPNRWNPKAFIDDWFLSIPFAGKSCYLENALEMLDEPGEWYLDRETGTLHYWPQPGEDLTRSEVVAPVLQKTLLAVVGTKDRPVVNLHFEGLRVEYVDWPQPPWGYMAMFCCNVATTDGPKPGHRPIEAAVEFAHARLCSFDDGGITRVGGMGLCLRDGTSQITIEGNEIGWLGGGGIAAGWPNCGAGYLEAAPPPAPGEFTGYRIANNHVHHCGLDFFGAVGILLMASHQAVVAHNLIHDTAYFGIGVAGSQDPKVTFDGDNVIEYNLIHDTMRTTIDGAGIYVTFPQHGQGTHLRGNVIYDTHGNPYHKNWGQHPPSAGLYLDGNSQGGIYEYNVLYRNFAAGPLIFDYPDARKKNHWIDNIFATDSLPPAEFLDALEAFAGLELVYQTKLLKTKARLCVFHVLDEPSSQGRLSAIQFDFPVENRGVIEVFVGHGKHHGVARFKLRGLDGASAYELHAFSSLLAPQKVWGPDKMPMIGTVAPVDLAALNIASRISGQDLIEKGLALKPGKSPQVIWIFYQATKL